jgi:hypothetical protein
MFYLGFARERVKGRFLISIVCGHFASELWVKRVA